MNNDNEKSIKVTRDRFDVAYETKNNLYMAYMPFVENGGLFIPTLKPYDMGDEVYVVLGLPDETIKISVYCKVVWITPAAAQGNSIPGIGVQFLDDGSTRSQIETLLGGNLQLDDATLTL